MRTDVWQTAVQPIVLVYL